MIIEEYDLSLFVQRFENMNRVETEQNPNGNFSYRSLRYLFEYLDETYDEENPLKLDVISLCCDYSEYKNLAEYLKDYSNQHEKRNIDWNNGETQIEYAERIEEEISDKTTLIKFEDSLEEGFIIGQF